MKNRKIEWFENRIAVMPESETKEMFRMAISALEKQEQAENEWCPDCAEYDKENHCCHRFTKVIRQTVEECKREWANEGWIPVTERLPEKEGLYLVAVKNDHDRRYSKTAWFYRGAWSLARQKILAWRPLPEAYTEEDNDV